MSPSDTSHKPLRQLAAEKLHGKGANPSMLGDPISLKAETSDNNNPRGDANANSNGNNDDDQGMPKSVRAPPPSSGGSHEEKKLKNGHHVRGMKTDETREGTEGSDVGAGAAGDWVLYMYACEDCMQTNADDDYEYDVRPWFETSCQQVPKPARSFAIGPGDYYNSIHGGCEVWARLGEGAAV
ncbi:hypothetical protein B0T17DRAFT_650925 [Bombardia bombarda]|uniref:Uncharacterized protein n=1 Tax=Bombardia bombarda TaxID=252184 RepID=A0AA39XMM1_9PEZI|nr:hypothetical protein B0T17DRAFT_650925 [Bombardia bombarda]